MTLNLIVQALENFEDGFGFERLCNDIMHLHYPRFKPGGRVHDLGADGLLVLDKDDTRLYVKTSSQQKQTFIFQYSLQQTWKRKIRVTLKKLKDNKVRYDRLVYVTSLAPTRASVVNLQGEAQSTYNKSLEIHDQEFLRVYLEKPENSYLVENYFASYLFQLKRWGIETSIFANVPLIERHKRKALVLLASCVRSQEGEEVKVAAATEVVIGCLYGEDGRVARSQNDITGELGTVFGDKGCLSESLIDTILNNLVKGNRIKQERGKYILTKEEITQIEAKIERAYEQDRSFYQSLLNNSSLKQELTFDQQRDVRMAIAKGIGRVFEQRGFEIANALVDQDVTLTLNEYPEVNLIVRDVVSDLPNELKAETSTIIQRLLTNPTSEEAIYLYGIAESYLVYASFNLDVDARILDLESIRRNVVFIDTDILVQILIGQPKLQNFYRQMLKATQNLGVTMYTLPQMIKELVHKIERAYEDYEYMNRPTNLSSRYLDDLGDIFKTYFTTHINAGRTWDQFINGILGTSRDRNARFHFVETRLETEYNVQCRDLKTEFALDSNKVDELSSMISKERDHLGSFKHEDLYKNDAIIALCLQELQQKDETQLYRLITSDLVLPRIWQEYANNQEHTFVFPPWGWFQYVTHHPASRTRPTDFSLLMKSLTVSPVRPRVPRNLILTLIHFGVNISYYTTEALEELNNRLYKQWVWRQVLTKRPSEITDAQIDDLKYALNNVLGEVEEVVAPDRAELREQHKQDEEVIKRLVSEKRELEEELAHYKKKQVNRERYQRRTDRQRSSEKSKSKRRH